MTARSWRRSWTAFASHDRVVAGDAPVRVQIGSSPTKATATRAVASCSDGARLRTPSHSAPISGRSAPVGQVARSSLAKRSMPVGMWSSAASIASNSDVGWLPATRNAPSITGRWWCSPPSSCGWSLDLSAGLQTEDRGMTNRVTTDGQYGRDGHSGQRWNLDNKQILG